MKKAVARFKNCYGLVFVMPVVAGLLGFTYVNTNVDPDAYREMAVAWPRLTPQIQEQIRASMSSGKMNRWDYRDIQNSIIETTHVLTYGALPIENEEKELTNLKKVMR
ncbi:hypothetical protein [Serratia ficaria]|uniref:hypothetical protein n=1 Tax=Serratia ficaria TaxID=61651 RepID=UPI002182F0A1|nr:hypothetical protein [Serratia ficaria]CAI2537488.1 Uncharacterised protein [Serratia ficaria]